MQKQAKYATVSAKKVHKQVKRFCLTRFLALMLLPFVLLGLRLGRPHRRGRIWGRRKRIGRRDSSDVDRIPGRRCDGGGDSDRRPVAETRRRRAGCNRGPAGAAPDVVGRRWEPARDCSPLSLFPESKMSLTLVKLQSLLMQNNFGVMVLAHEAEHWTNGQKDLGSYPVIRL